jgi:hypothetical protein
LKSDANRETLAGMKNKLMLACGLAVLGLGASTAFAGGSEGSLGVGAEGTINLQLGGMSANYDMGQFHVGGFFGFDDGPGDDNTNIYLGGRFFYHLHSTAMSDFSVGGGVGVGFLGGPADTDRTVVFIEPGVQTRAFVASNVALSFTAGMSLGVADADGVEITGQINALAGVHYYFF